MNDFDGFDEYNENVKIDDFDEYDEFDEDDEYEEYDEYDEFEDDNCSKLPEFELKGIYSFRCPDGFVALDIKEAKAHGYNSSGKGCSMGMGPSNGLFEKFDFSFLPEIEKFGMELEKTYGVFDIRYFDDGYNFKTHELWYTSYDIENGKLKPLVGTPNEPYNYIDQGYDVYIFEKNGFVIVIMALNWEEGSTKFTGFKVKADTFYNVWNEMPFPEPYR